KMILSPRLATIFSSSGVVTRLPRFQIPNHSARLLRRQALGLAEGPVGSRHLSDEVADVARLLLPARFGGRLRLTIPGSAVVASDERVHVVSSVLDLGGDFLPPLILILLFLLQ